MAAVEEDGDEGSAGDEFLERIEQAAISYGYDP